MMLNVPFIIRMFKIFLRGEKAKLLGKVKN